MKILTSIFIAILAQQGTMSTDDSDVSRAEASLSGVSESMEIQEEEVRIEDEVDDEYQEEEEIEPTSEQSPAP